MGTLSDDLPERNSGAPPRPPRASVSSRSPDGRLEVHTVKIPAGVSLAHLVAALATLPRDVVVDRLREDGDGGQVVFVGQLDWKRSGR